MSDYPSRKAQLVRALHLGQTPPSARAAEILFHSILSFQGERWQVFDESPAEWTLLLILGRQALVKAGFGVGPSPVAAEVARRARAADDSRPLLPALAGGTDWLSVDDTCAAAAEASVDRLGALLERAGIRLGQEARPSAGLWDLFAGGAVEEGVERARALVRDLTSKGVRRVVALEGQAVWVWRTLLPEIGVRHPFEVRDVLDMATRLDAGARAFLSAGSFRARALQQAERINGLLEPGKRANTVTIWQRPVCAEHALVGFPAATERLILEDALEEIRASRCERVVAFSAHEYRKLRAAGLSEEVVYFTEVIA